jgi:putative Ca2+/H+ antiporter (TMEM165/GDT1 family)
MIDHHGHKKRWLIIGGIAALLLIFVLFVDVGAVFSIFLQTHWGVWFLGVAFLLGGLAVAILR